MAGHTLVHVTIIGKLAIVRRVQMSYVGQRTMLLGIW